MDPQNYSASETLKDGTPITIRAIRHDDGNTILEAFKNLDRDSVYRRFFSPKKDLTAAELEQLTDVDFSQVVALVRHLVRVARDAGVSRLEADVLAENQPMLAVFRHSGLPVQFRRDGGVLHVTLSLQ